MDEQEKNEFEKLKAEIEQIRKDYTSAKSILSSITQFNDTFQKLKELLGNSESGIEANFNFTKTQKDQIDTLSTQAQTQVGEITTSLQKVKANIESMQTAYSEFSEIKGKVSGVTGEIDTLLTTARGLKDDISTTKKDSLEILENIKGTYQTVSENITNMQTAYQSFLQINSKLEDEKTGLKAVFDSVQSLNVQSGKLFSEIKSLRDSSKASLTDIENNKTKTDELKSEIQSNFDFTEQKKIEIEKATGLIIDTSFAETFKRRQDEIEKGLYSWYSWKNILFISVVILIILVVLPFTRLLDFGTTVWYELFLSRIYYTSPVLFLIAFSAVQYSKERDLAEKYAFKAASSAAIRSHIDYLSGKFDVKNDESMKSFAKDTFSTIYKEPHSSVSDFEKRLKDLEKKQNTENRKDLIDINQIVSSVKELKELLPEKTLFEKVLSVFIKN